MWFLSKCAFIEKYRTSVKVRHLEINSILECTGVKLICPDYYKSISTEELIWLVTKKLSLLKTFDNLIKGFKIILTDKKEYFIKIHEDHENYADLTYALDNIQSRDQRTVRSNRFRSVLDCLTHSLTRVQFWNFFRRFLFSRTRLRIQNSCVGVIFDAQQDDRFFSKYWCCQKSKINSKNIFLNFWVAKVFREILRNNFENFCWAIHP